jgi:hypothetical protein
MEVLEISYILFVKNGNPRVFEKFFNCIKYKKSLKATKFEESP